jgi:PTS system mannose-specific IIC component
MSLNAFQVILITLIAFWKGYDFQTVQLFPFNSLIWGALTGLALGDLKTGLYVGGTIQLMSLGVVAIGGASAPDYPIACIIATTISIALGRGGEEGLAAGLALGIPVGMLGVQLDIIVKILNDFVGKKAQSLANEKKFKAMERITLLGPIMMGLICAIPVLISITLGQLVVENILSSMPTWFTTGLAIAGGLLPAVGIAMLLTYMPIKRFFNYLLVGFVLSAYLKMPILGIAIIGFALAFEYYFRKVNETEAVIVGGLQDE